MIRIFVDCTCVKTTFCRNPTPSGHVGRQYAKFCDNLLKGLFFIGLSDPAGDIFHDVDSAVSVLLKNIFREH